MTAHDLLADAFLSWRTPDRTRYRSTLPGVLAAMSSGRVGDFCRVRPHQFEPWSMFLTQLAAIAMHRAGCATPPTSEPEWLAMLLPLTEDQREPWCLVVEDLAKPAFFQPPVPDGGVQSWSRCEHPDDVDVLVTSKAHDVKTSQIPPDDVEMWVYALCALQTAQGYPGRGYNGVARMNGGYGNRPRVGYAPDLAVSTRFSRDVSVLLEDWASQLARGYSDSGAGLLWVVPWDGQSSLMAEQLSPHFIEVCWRIRLVPAAMSLAARYTTTRTRRSLGHLSNGDVGDAWIPVERATGNALTVGPRGFHYRLVARLLLQNEFEPGVALRLRAADGDPIMFLASAMARGQGKTEGLHQRSLVLSGSVRRLLGRPDGRETLGRRAQSQVQRADDIGKKVLYPALKTLVGNGTLPSVPLDERVDALFFGCLMRDLDQSDERARINFDQRLVEVARQVLESAAAAIPVSDVRRLRRLTESEVVFWGHVQREFADALDARPVEEGVE